MCYGDDARAPFPPIRGGAGDRGDLVLKSADGNEFGAYFAHPDTVSDRAIVILPDVRGLHEFYKDLAVRFAEAGVHALAVDYFGRTAGIGERGEDFEFRPHVDQLAFDHVDVDVDAATSWLRDLPGVTIHSMFTVGFCFGGSMSWRQAADGRGITGSIGLYGIPSRVEDKIAVLTAPLLVLAPGQDFTPVNEVEQFVEKVRNAGGDAELHIYPDAPHSYFDRKSDEFSSECADSWTRILAFIDAHA